MYGGARAGAMETYHDCRMRKQPIILWSSLALNAILLGRLATEQFTAAKERVILSAIEVGYQEGCKNGHQAQMTINTPDDDHQKRLARARQNFNTNSP